MNKEQPIIKWHENDNFIKEFLIGKTVRVTKLSSLNEKSESNDHTLTLPGESWWCEGVVTYFNECLWLLRTKNYNYPNGRDGVFYTSKIKETTVENHKLVIITQNSKYSITEVQR